MSYPDVMSSRLRVRVLVASVAGALLALVAVNAGAAPVPPVPLPVIEETGHVVALPDVPKLATWPVFDARGKYVGKRTWRTTTAGGNCCETYESTTSRGRLLEFGGKYPTFSDDNGVTWKQALPVVPLYNAEGAILSLTDGSIFGVTWDAYTGDRLQGYRYDPKSNTWTMSEVQLHSAFYDRPWITYAKGPFTINGQTYP